jgi:hypothetical protein
MQGLKQLVDMGGGIESLYSEPMILNKIYRWVTFAHMVARMKRYED